MAQPMAVTAFIISGLSVALVLGTGPVRAFVAPIGAILGLIALVRREPAATSGRALATGGIGAVVAVRSLVMVTGSHPA